MRLNTFIKYDQTCTVLRYTGAGGWVEDGPIKIKTHPNDRMGFIIMKYHFYFREDSYRFVNFRNTRGEILYPAPSEPQGRVYQTFSVDARMDAWGLIQYFSYMLKAVPE